MDDFFSNGFFKFFNEIDEELLTWEDDYNNYYEPTTNTADDSQNQNQYNQSNSFGNYSTNQSVLSYDSDYDIVFSELKNMQQPSVISDNNINELPPIFDNRDWETNIETLLFDNSIEFSSELLTNHQQHEQQSLASQYLPDKTVLCNDSCTIFLKESAENLYTNLQTFSMPASPESLTSSVNSQQLTTNNNNEILSTDKIMFPCTFVGCAKNYAKAAHLKAHLRRHIGDKPYVCTWPECTWKFSRSDELARHRRSHSGIKPYECIYCTKCFSRSDHLSKHRKVHERKMALAANKMKNSMNCNKMDVQSNNVRRYNRHSRNSNFFV